MKKTLIAFALLVLLAVCAAFGCRTLLQKKKKKKYIDVVEKYAAEYDVPENLIYAVIRTESTFRPAASSDVGALGLMQIMPETLEWLNMRMGTTTDFASLTEPDVAVRYGTYFLHLLLTEFGETDTALAAYHAGMGRVKQWLADEKYSADGRTIDRIPFRDTAHYVRKVERAVSMYENLYKS